MNLLKTLKPYDYRFPAGLIAQAPASPRDAARLLVFDRASGQINYGRFRDLPRFLPPGAVLVFNETKVLPARLVLTKPTGGRVRVLYVSGSGGLIRVLADRRLEPGLKLALGARLSFRAVRRDGKYWLLRPSFALSRLPAILERHGQAPLPPYIRQTPLTAGEAKEKYQTVFARRPGSVAAPTASLHFTKRLLASLKRRGFAVKFVTLHVNLGTFAPLTPESLKRGRLHVEHYEIPPAAARSLNAAKRAGRPIVAVGTTVVRTLESAAGRQGHLHRLKGETEIFIRPGYHFRFVDRLITNFHVPQSSLMMLVSAFVGRRRLLEIYRRAIRRRFRLFSFGDGMLIR